MRGKKAKILRRAVTKAIAGDKTINAKRIYRRVKKDYMASSRVLNIT
jgi:hypothetical protein